MLGLQEKKEARVTTGFITAGKSKGQAEEKGRPTGQGSLFSSLMLGV